MGGIQALCLPRRCTEKNTWLLPKMQNPNLFFFFFFFFFFF